MGIVLAGHQYGKAENRVVRFQRDRARHEIIDLNVTSTMRGDFADAYLAGDQSKVLPTDTQKNTIYAYAKRFGDKEKGITSPETYGLDLARHFVDDVGPISGARIDVESYPWTRAVVDGVEHDHTWTRSGSEVRTAAVTVQDTGPEVGAPRETHVVAGLKEFTLLKSTASAYQGFLVDGYTTLEPTDDRVLATSLVADWRYDASCLGDGFDFNAAYDAVKAVMVEQFATLHSLALQQTLWHMGKAAVESVPGVVEVRLAAPNKHHFLYDLGRFGVENAGEVFHADDRPYGLIQAVIARDDVPEAPWRGSGEPRAESVDQRFLDQRFLDRAVDLATENVADGGGPFGAVLVRDGVVLATGTNRVTRDNDPTAHAEVQAIRAACRDLGTFSLAGATLYSSCEPCPMCLASALWARVARVVYAADRDDAARGGFDDREFYELFATPREAWSVPVQQQRDENSPAPFDAWLASVQRVDY